MRTRFYATLFAIGIALLLVTTGFVGSQAPKAAGDVIMKEAIINGASQIGGSGNVQNNQIAFGRKEDAAFVAVEIPSLAPGTTAIPIHSWVFRIEQGSETLATIDDQGIVTVNPKFTIDDVSRAFWASVMLADRGALCHRVLGLKP